MISNNQGHKAPAGLTMLIQRAAQHRRIGMLFMTLGIVVVLIVIAVLMLEARFVLSAQESVGTVMGYHTIESKNLNSPNYVLIVEFYTKQGQRVDFASSYGGGPTPLAVGGRVPIIYDPANPNDAQIAVFLNIWGFKFFPLLAAGFCFCSGALFLKLAGSESGQAH